MSDIFKALADPTRREILLMIAENSVPINDIACQFQISRPAISKHIRLLTEAGLLKVNATQDGRQRLLELELKAFKEVEDYLVQLEKFWLNRLDRLSDHLSKDE